MVELEAQKAPKTTENFLQYVRAKHYDGTIFHRVIENFMVQGGGYDASYVERKTRAPVAHEGREALSRGGPRNVVGTLAMARTNDPNSATAQFFINVVDNMFLSEPRGGAGYAVFGKVVAGMENVDKIKGVKTGFKNNMPDWPVEDVVLKTAKILNAEASAKYAGK